MTEPTDYVPPKVWSWNKETGGRFAAINRPVAGPTLSIGTGEVRDEVLVVRRAQPSAGKYEYIPLCPLVH